MVSQSGGEISPDSSQTWAPWILCALRRAMTRVVQSKLKTRSSFIQKVGSQRSLPVSCSLNWVECVGVTESECLWVQIQLGFTSRRWFLLCALTCTDARGPVFTLTQLLPAGGVVFHHLHTRDITHRALAGVHRCPLSSSTAVLLAKTAIIRLKLWRGHVQFGKFTRTYLQIALNFHTYTNSTLK